jgi:DNA-binding IclR family transcriptional regulator
MDQKAEQAELESAAGKQDAYYVPGLQRGLRVLEIVAAAQRPPTVSEMAEQLAITRSSAFRLIYTLRDMGFLEAIPNTKSVQLGPRVLNIGFAYLARMDILEIARPDLERLRDQTNVTAHLAIRDGRELLYLSCVQTRSGFLSTMNVGARLPASATPMGWLLLADLPAAERATLFAEADLPVLTEQTPRDMAALERRIAAASALGYVISHGIVEAGGSSISAPIRNRDGRVAAAIDIAGPDSAFDLSEFETRYAAELVAAATRISRRLGHAGPAVTVSVDSVARRP